MVEIQRCAEFRTGVSREGRPLSWCLKSGSDLGCNGYSDGCPTPDKFTISVAGALKHKYPEPVRTQLGIEGGREKGNIVVLAVSGR
jgi:hypothetical protein